jgi:cytochrome c553
VSFAVFSGRRLGLYSLAALAGGLLLLAADSDLRSWLRGAAIYHGYVERPGRIMGHQSDLPAEASRCANCHDAPVNSNTQRGVAVLSSVTLVENHSRRGGPPVAYTEESFCTFLQSGVDPAFVMADRTMPRFSLNDDDCAALWRYVSSR